MGSSPIRFILSELRQHQSLCSYDTRLINGEGVPSKCFQMFMVCRLAAQDTLDGETEVQVLSGLWIYLKRSFKLGEPRLNKLGAGLQLDWFCSTKILFATQCLASAKLCKMVGHFSTIIKEINAYF